MHKAIKNEIFRYIVEELSKSHPHLLLSSLHAGCSNVVHVIGVVHVDEIERKIQK